MSLSNSRMTRRTLATRLQFSGVNGLADGSTAYPGGLACVDTGDGSIKPGAVGTGLIPIGFFADLGPVVADGATAPVTIDLIHERSLVWMKNDVTDAVTADMLLQNCYVFDDETVSSDASGTSVAGVIWGVDAIKGVLVALAG
jgi:hypothetical protein